ncbi:hypothetical protein D3C86_823610 [compost metagenome]
MMPVRDGRPTKADVDLAFRMTSSVDMIPGVARPWFLALNRGGEWTIDEAGRYVPFDGLTPRNVFSLNYVVEGDGRVVGLDREHRVLALDPGDAGFRMLLQLEQGPLWRPSVTRLPRAGVTLVTSKGGVRRLVGDRLEPWAEGKAMVAAGVADLYEIHDLAVFGAALFVGAGGAMAVRFDDGRWTRLPALNGNTPRGLSWGEYVREVTPAPASGAALIDTDRRHIALRFPGSDGAPVSADTLARFPDTMDAEGEKIFVASGPGEILRFRQINPDDAPIWSRLTSSGFEDIQGAFALRRGGEFIFGRPEAVPSRGWMVFASQDSIVVYDGHRMKPLAASASDVVGSLPRLIDVPGLDRVLISGDRGLFELDHDRSLRKLVVPFQTGGLPGPLIAPAPHARQVVVVAADGLFAFQADRTVARIPGGENVRVSFGDEILGEIPVSHDLLIRTGNALHLVVNKGSSRWPTCIAASGA